MALDALEPAQRCVIRLEMYAVSGRRCDIAPVLRIALDVTFDAYSVRHVRVRLQAVRVLEDLRACHRAAGHDSRPVTRLAAEVAVRAARKPLVGMHHEVA